MYCNNMKARARLHPRYTGGNAQRDPQNEARAVCRRCTAGRPGDLPTPGGGRHECRQARASPLHGQWQDHQRVHHRRWIEPAPEPDRYPGFLARKATRRDRDIHLRRSGSSLPEIPGHRRRHHRCKRRGVREIAGAEAAGIPRRLLRPRQGHRLHLGQDHHPQFRFQQRQLHLYRGRRQGAVHFQHRSRSRVPHSADQAGHGRHRRKADAVRQPLEPTGVHERQQQHAAGRRTAARVFRKPGRPTTRSSSRPTKEPASRSGASPCRTSRWPSSAGNR